MWNRRKIKWLGRETKKTELCAAGDRICEKSANKNWNSYAIKKNISPVSVRNLCSKKKLVTVPNKSANGHQLIKFPYPRSIWFIFCHSDIGTVRYLLQCHSGV
jgi:hypothetical protein